MSDRNVLKEKSLPPIECFNSTLGVGRIISQDDYIHALKVWDVFECESIKDYTEIYVELDVLLLAELFSYFKDFCKEVGYTIIFIIIKIYF